MNRAQQIPGGLSDQAAISILLVAVAGVGIVIGMTFPLVTLSLERMNFGAVLIGLNSATGSLGILVVGVMTGRLLSRYGAFSMILVACIVTVLSLILMPVTGMAAGWFALRFLLSLGIGFIWLISEAWLNTMVDDDKRGHVMGLYGTSFSGGFALGPLIVSLTGSQGWLPFAVTAGIMAVSSLPMVFLAGSRIVIEKSTSGHLGLLRLFPFIFIIAFAAGLFETTAYALLPVYTLGEGLDETGSLYALSAFSAGGIALQYPMGKLADAMGRYALMVVTALGVLACVVAVPFVIGSLTLLLPVLFLLGGSVFGLYTLGLILLGDRFGLEHLVAANAVFIILYETGGVIGPALAGPAMEAWPQHGFIGFLLVFAVLFAVLTVMRRKG